jgi:hypothetical protein
MAQKLFEYAVLYHPKPTKEQRDAGEEVGSVILVSPTTTLAKDEKIAAMVVARAIPQEYVDKLDKVEIIIRPF